MKRKGIAWIIVAIGGAIGAVGSELLTQIISNGLPKKDKEREKEKDGGE